MNLLFSVKAFVFGFALSFASGILTQVQTVEPADPNSQAYKLAVAAENLPSDVRYVAKYQYMDYPGGDIPADQGVCTDVLIRAFREQGIDLQVKVHEHRKSKGLETDKCIDHRRVPNQAAYFKSQQMEIPIPQDKYKVGDIIWWKIGGPDGVNHIGIVVRNGKVVHNIGHGVWADVSPDFYHVYKVYRLSDVPSE
tara:strand:+ start:173 stop:757 length:585 start_codon:yes stop_codon:yes gene_type:complete